MKSWAYKWQVVASVMFGHVRSCSVILDALMVIMDATVFNVALPTLLAALMWRGYEDALGLYLNAMIAEWERRGYMNTLARYPLPESGEIIMSPWPGDEALHASHRSNLVRKDPGFYGRYGWAEAPELPYVWPVRLERRGRVGAGRMKHLPGTRGGGRRDTRQRW